MTPDFTDDEAQAWQELKSMLKLRIEDALAGRISPRSISDIIAEELGTPDRGDVSV